MKKLTCMVVIICLLISLVGCGNGSQDATSLQKCSISGCENDVYKDGLCPDHYVAAHSLDKEEPKEEELDQDETVEGVVEIDKEAEAPVEWVETGEVGLKNIKYDTSKDLTDEQRMIAEYFNRDYVFVNSTESLQRYNKIFDNALIKTYVYVEKVISYEDDNYSLLVKMINNSDELGEWFAPLSSLDSDRRMIIKGTSGDSRYIVGDKLQVNGRYMGVETEQVDGESLTVPIIDVARVYLVDMNKDPDSWWYVEKPSRFTDKEVKQIAKCIFGDDIMIRKDKVADYDFSYNQALYNMDYRDVMGSDVWGYNGPCYVCELDDQSNAKFSKYFFNERMGTMTDAVHTNYEMSFSGDFSHFYLFMYDKELESLTLEYYDNDFNKLWKREFEDTTSASYDVTESNIYLCANNEFYIISCETGEDVIDSVYIGNKLDIRKFASGTLAIDSNKSDAFMFLDDAGQIRWKVDAIENVNPGYGWDTIQTQEVDGKILISTVGSFKEFSENEVDKMGAGYGYQYFYYVINIETGELEYSGDVITRNFQNYG